MSWRVDGSSEISCSFPVMFDEYVSSTCHTYICLIRGLEGRGERGRNWPSLYFCACCFFDIKILILCTYELTSVYAFTLKHVIFLTQNWSSISFSVYHDFIDYSNIYSLEPWHNTNIDDIFIGHFFRSLFSSFNLLSTSLFRLEVVWTNATLHYRRSLHV